MNDSTAERFIVKRSVAVPPLGSGADTSNSRIERPVVFGTSAGGAVAPGPRRRRRRR
ncbi:hypothetical protein ACFQRB_19955 [Halobaculum litoreum]|uniref:Uncharacterized protein n=1 Tax=Halobaculum litoreum TaxID=3031998 RepID=A0ABD5XX84_9EURY